MVREEYLNLEFVYKFINSLCKRDGYHMTDFEFGKMSYYRSEDTPFILRNNMGYNIVYRFKAWKLPEQFDLNSMVYFRYADDPLCKQTEGKTFCFDLHSECIVECGKVVECGKERYEFQPNPPFFRLDNQLYYAIYNQPKALHFHYSEGRDIKDIKDYMEYMEIDCYNILPATEVLCNVTGKGSIFYKSKEEANEDIRNLLSKTYKCDQWYNIEYYCRLNIKIHKDNAPVFYTDNVLELTIPLAEDIKKLKDRLDCALVVIHHCFGLMLGSIQTLMQQRLEDLARTIRLETENMFKLQITNGSRDFYDTLDEKMGELEKVADRYVETNRKPNNLGSLAFENYRLESDNTYRRIITNIQKMREETLSVDSLSQLAKDFDLLEAQVKSLQRG